MRKPVSSTFWIEPTLGTRRRVDARLLNEIDRSDLFHLCWSSAASKSEWVIEKEGGNPRAT